MSLAESVPVLERPGIRQFVKFCIVGASSFAIDAGISALLIFRFGMWWVPANTISFVLAVTNGFFWNQRWTFRAVGHRRHQEQYAMFVGVNIVGLVINLAIMKSVFFIATGQWQGQQPTGMRFAIAKVAATAVVVFWNFFANKHWTFRAPEA